MRTVGISGAAHAGAPPLAHLSYPYSGSTQRVQVRGGKIVVATQARIEALRQRWGKP